MSLAWLPFDPELLGGVPAGVKVEVFDARGELPPSRDRVELYVPAYRFDPAVFEVIPSLPRLRVVQTLTAGVEHVRPHLRPGIVLCNARGVHDASTAELAVALTLASLRGIPQFVRAQDAGRWAHEERLSLADRRVLIVGYGGVGAAIERRLEPFECTISRVARRARDGVDTIDALPRLLPSADVVILTVPLTPQTEGLVDAGFLASMHDGALLVNVARGAVVRREPLLAELRSGRLRAALDVTDPEPLPPHDPLWAAPGLLVSPHVGGASSAMWPRAYALVAAQLARYAAAEPLLNVVDETTEG